MFLLSVIQAASPLSPTSKPAENSNLSMMKNNHTSNSSATRTPKTFRDSFISSLSGKKAENPPSPSATPSTKWTFGGFFKRKPKRSTEESSRRRSSPNLTNKLNNNGKVNGKLSDSDDDSFYSGEEKFPRSQNSSQNSRGQNSQFPNSLHQNSQLQNSQNQNSRSQNRSQNSHGSFEEDSKLQGGKDWEGKEEGNFLQRRLLKKKRREEEKSKRTFNENDFLQVPGGWEVTKRSQSGSSTSLDLKIRGRAAKEAVKARAVARRESFLLSSSEEDVESVGSRSSLSSAQLRKRLRPRGSSANVSHNGSWEARVVYETNSPAMRNPPIVKGGLKFPLRVKEDKSQFSQHLYEGNARQRFSYAESPPPPPPRDFSSGSFYRPLSCSYLYSNEPPRSTTRSSNNSRYENGSNLSYPIYYEGISNYTNGSQSRQSQYSTPQSYEAAEFEFEKCKENYNFPAYHVTQKVKMGSDECDNINNAKLHFPYENNYNSRILEGNSNSRIVEGKCDDEIFKEIPQLVVTSGNVEIHKWRSPSEPRNEQKSKLGFPVRKLDNFRMSEEREFEKKKHLPLPHSPVHSRASEFWRKKEEEVTGKRSVQKMRSLESSPIPPTPSPSDKRIPAGPLRPTALTLKAPPFPIGSSPTTTCEKLEKTKTACERLNVAIPSPSSSVSSNLNSANPPTPSPTPTPAPRTKFESAEKSEKEVKAEKKYKHNLEEALNELEDMYRSLRLSDEELLDRAERRDLPTVHQEMRHAPMSPAIGSLDSLVTDCRSPSLVMSSENLNRVRAPPLRRSFRPDTTNDDMAKRRFESPKGGSGSDPLTVIGKSGSYIGVSPVFSPTNPPTPGDLIYYDDPDITTDDVNVVKYKRANSSNIADPQLPFGIPVAPVAAAPNSDYLHAQPIEKFRPLFRHTRRPDVVKDDIAYRALRKDLGAEIANVDWTPRLFPSSPAPPLSPDDKKTGKKNRAIRSLSANITQLVHSNTQVEMEVGKWNSFSNETFQPRRRSFSSYLEPSWVDQIEEITAAAVIKSREMAAKNKKVAVVPPNATRRPWTDLLLKEGEEENKEKEEELFEDAQENVGETESHLKELEKEIEEDCELKFPFEKKKVESVQLEDSFKEVISTSSMLIEKEVESESLKGEEELKELLESLVRDSESSKMSPPPLVRSDEVGSSSFKTAESSSGESETSETRPGTPPEPTSTPVLTLRVKESRDFRDIGQLRPSLGMMKSSEFCLLKSKHSSHKNGVFTKLHFAHPTLHFNLACDVLLVLDGVPVMKLEIKTTELNDVKREESNIGKVNSYENIVWRKPPPPTAPSTPTNYNSSLKLNEEKKEKDKSYRRKSYLNRGMTEEPTTFDPSPDNTGERRRSRTSFFSNSSPIPIGGISDSIEWRVKKPPEIPAILKGGISGGAKSEGEGMTGLKRLLDEEKATKDLRFIGGIIKSPSAGTCLRPLKKDLVSSPVDVNGPTVAARANFFNRLEAEQKAASSSSWRNVNEIAPKKPPRFSTQPVTPVEFEIATQLIVSTPPATPPTKRILKHAIGHEELKNTVSAPVSLNRLNLLSAGISNEKITSAFVPTSPKFAPSARKRFFEARAGLGGSDGDLLDEDAEFSSGGQEVAEIISKSYENSPIVRKKSWRTEAKIKSGKMSQEIWRRVVSLQGKPPESSNIEKAGSSNLLPVTPTAPWRTNKTQQPAPPTSHLFPILTALSSSNDELNEAPQPPARIKRGRSSRREINVPNPNDETFQTFFGGNSWWEVGNGKREVQKTTIIPIEVEGEIDIARDPLLPPLKKGAPIVRRKSSGKSKNPLKALAARMDFRNQKYTENPINK